MDKKSDLRNGKYNSSALLLIVLIGFCILAIIEILYGQAQIRMERERLALEEENNQAVQELKAEWNSLKGDPSVGTESIEAVGEEQGGNSESEKTLINTGDASTPDSGAADGMQDGGEQSAEDDKEYAMQIVVLGDSIMAHNSENTQDVPSLIGEACNAKVYNMAIGGTTAAVLPEEQLAYDKWGSLSLIGVVNAILGNISPDVFDRYETGKSLRECDFNKTDYFIIEYGINDFLCRQVPRSKYLEDGGVLDYSDAGTYAESLDLAINLLHGKFPNAKILLVSPHYCQFFSSNAYIGDAYSLDYGCGTLVDFFRTMMTISERYKADNVMFCNAMEQSGIDAYTAREYLADGIHLSEAGRRVYADHVAKLINEDFYREE